MNIERLTVGHLVNTHGIRGEVKVMPVTDFPEARFKAGNRLIVSHATLGDREFTVDRVRVHRGFYILHFEGVDSINEVEGYKGGTLQVNVEEQLPLPEGEYYFHEIIGADVYDEAHHHLGVVKEILTPGANDVWVVKRPQKPDLLLPVIDECIRHVDIKQKKIVVHLMPGLD
jgi:16S rRNA processing protein RimM